MAENPPPTTGEQQPPRQPYGPGVLMMFGLACLGVAVWCGMDFFYPKEDWVKGGQTGTIWMNGIGMTLFAVVAIYCFVLAAIRARSASPDASRAPPSPPQT
jgi:hypothetical protein